jgi:translocator protein
MWLFGLLMWLIICYAASAVGAWASLDAGNFYSQLQRPSWAPPGWLFGPVWMVLYGMMGVSVWLVWRKRVVVPCGRAVGVFLLQLCANAAWSWIFFAWKLGALAVIEILVLWCLILWTIILFWRSQRLAAYLLLPYLAWVSFATVLTMTLWRMNPSLLH